ncbi:MAG: ABC transporter ATP-binding protein [Candidatus Sabulitectum sp.]|nr:ABC transporter ATP-binding protein [Candidatus Sabulitectum sp.]
MADVHPLQVKRLSKRFPRKRGLGSVQAVSDLSFAVRQGEIVGFIGHNGAGKTTTIKCLLGLLKPSEGSISLWGYTPASRKVRARIGYIPENPDYDDSFSPMEYLSMFASMRGLSGDDKSWLKLLKRVGLSSWETTGIRQFSKGMRQRMSLAIALQSNPDLLVLDEPTGGLDPMARKEFREIIIEENKRGASVFLSSHILSDVETICHRAVILSRGKLVTEGSMKELLGGENLYRIVVISRKTGEEIEEIIPEADLQSRIDSLRRDNLPIVKVEMALKSLEDVFLSAAGGESK